MIKVKDGYAKLIGTTASGSASRVLLSNGGDHVLGNASGNIPLNNGTVSTNLNADMLDGLHIHTGRNNEVNKVVRTDGSGYILAGWINTTSGDMGTTAATRIYCSNDGYIRYKTPANFFSALTNSSNLLSITVGDQNRKVTVAYATKAGDADLLDGKHASAFALASHGVHWEGFTKRANSNASWGTLISSNGYTPLFWLDSTNTGGVAFSDKSGQTFMQIDGYFYQNEGKYLVLDTNNYSSYTDGRYVNVSGDTMTGPLTFANGTWNVVGDDAAIGDYNAAGMLGLKSINNNIPGIGFHNSSNTLLGRLQANGSNLLWNDNKIWHAGNDGSGSGLDADLLDGYHISTAGTTKPWSTIVTIGSDGVSEMGRYIDFHYDNTTGSDYSTRLLCGGNHSNVVTLPSATGTLALTSQIPSVTNYYWANVKVSSTSSTTTTPTFALTTATAYIATQNGQILLWGPSKEYWLGSNTTSDFYLWGSSSTAHLRLGTNNTERVRVTKDGNVGIGTTSPSYNLSVGSSICANFNTNGSRVLLEPAAGGVTGGGIAFWGSSGWHNGTINASVLVLNNASGGYVGIGTANPSEKLQIAGNICIQALDSSTRPAIYLGHYTSWGGTTYPTLKSGATDQWVMHFNPHVCRSTTTGMPGSNIRMESVNSHYWDISIAHDATDNFRIRYDNSKNLVTISNNGLVSLANSIVFTGSVGSGAGTYLAGTGTDGLFLAANESGKKVFLESTNQDSPWFRNKNGDYQILHSGNYSSWALPALRMRNYSNGTSYHGAIPYAIALKAAGTPVYTDPEFASGNNEVYIYNNSGNSTVAITRLSDDLGSANSSGYILKIYNNGGTSSPGRGGFYQPISARQNAVFAQIFRAKIPTGFSVYNAENHMGNGYTTYWLTDTAGTGKWEWYIRITICGNGGSYSGGGHVYLNGSGAVTWYLAYCNLIDLTKGNYDGLRTKYADSASSATYATNSTYLYASDSPYRYGDTAPYYMRMRYNTNSDNRWYLSVYPETPKTVAVDYAYSAGNADTTDGVHIEWAGSQAASDTTWVVGWNANGTKLKAVKRADLSVNYASSAGSAASAGYTTRLYANSTTNLTTYPGDYSLAYSRFQADASNIFPCGNNANGVITAHLHAGEYYAQIGLSSNGRMYYRTMMALTLSSGVGWNLVAWSGESYTKSEADSRFINASGDTMTGTLYLGDSKHYLQYYTGGKYVELYNATASTGIGVWDTGEAKVFNSSGLYKIWHAGNDGSGSGLDADLLDGYHEYSFLRYRDLGSNSGATLWSQIGIRSYHNALPEGLSGIYNYGGVVSFPGNGSRLDIFTNHVGSSESGGLGGLWWRSGWNDDKRTWRRIIDSGNIANLSVSYATSAGNADTVDGQHFNWNNNKNDHTYLWAASSNGQAYLVHRASMSVNYATSAGTSSNVVVNNSDANSTYRIVWHSGNTLYGTNNIYCNPSADLIYSAGFRHVSYNSASYLLRSDGGAAGFHWSGQSGQPTWLWGGNSQHAYYVYNPSNFSVNYANSAGNSDKLDGYHAGDFLRYEGWWSSGSGQNVDNANGMTFVYGNHGSPNGWGILCTFDYQYNSSYKFQLFAEGYSAAGMYYRCRSADRGGWTGWKTVIDSGNIGSQSVNYATYSRYVYCTSGSYLNFQWSGQGGLPTWLFGSNDGANVYVWNPSNFNVNSAAVLRGNASNPDNSHPGHGAKVFYSWNTGQVGNASSGYSNGITIGSHPSDTAYGFQIVQNMWDDRTYTRRYNGGWLSWKTLAWTSDIPSVGNGTIIINQGGSEKGRFTVNQSGTTTINLTDSDTNTWRGIENVLTSTSTSNSLTANMGRVLANGGSDRPIVLLAGTLYRSGASSSYTTWYFTGYRHRSISSSNPTVLVSGGVAKFYFTNASGYGFIFAQVCANHQASGEATGYHSGEYQIRSSGLFWFGTCVSGLYLYIRAIALGNDKNDTAESYSGMWTNYSDGVTRVSIIAVGYAW